MRHASGGGNIYSCLCFFQQNSGGRTHVGIGVRGDEDKGDDRECEGYYFLF